MNYKVITSPDQLISCVEQINSYNTISVDLEFDKNRYRYGFNLCLLQIKAGSDIFLIDLISEKLDITPVFKPLENDNIEKVVFSFGEDIRLLHNLGCKPKNIFDIAIQTRLLNYPAISLTNLLKEEIGVECGKSSQKSNWFVRPLTQSQLNYAAEDVEYLIELKQKIQKKQSEEITSFIEEENKLYELNDFSENLNSNGLKHKDKKGLTEYQWFIYNGLMDFREQFAKEINRPSHFVINKEYLRDISMNHSELQKFHQQKSIYRKLRNNSFKNQIQNKLNELISEAEKMNCSTVNPAIKSLSKTDYEQLNFERIKNEQYIAEVLKPIQQKIAIKYGENTALFIFSNRIMLQVAINGFEYLPKYKQNILSELGLVK